ncbi:hypothetical protein [Vulcanisaeta distributa]|uniref:hypothetical protein n=1 Tax=Vulcanisaeta distributa TaxID=164451 RepID=UPI001FB55671|nr:hypothetical protein [Vulcanisaeta distributa]
MAMKALDLENDPIANSLVKVAIETDTANITSEEAERLDLAVRFASYPEKIFIIKSLAINGLQALSNSRISRLIERGYRARRLMLEIADKIPIKDVINIYSPPIDLGISYRQLTIELQHRGAKMVNILLRLSRRAFRYYCGLIGIAHMTAPRWLRSLVAVVTSTPQVLSTSRRSSIQVRVLRLS